MKSDFQIVQYSSNDKALLLKLLLDLQLRYFKENAPALIRELEREVDTEGIYSRYIDELEKDEENSIMLLAKDLNQTGLAFIIGRVVVDDDMVLKRIGVVEDWFVSPEHRGAGIGLALYHKLENWFREKGCHQLHSGTWTWNDISIEMHKKLGFISTEVKFIKKIGE